MRDEEKLEELAKQAQPALRHTELVILAEKAGSKHRAKRLMRTILLPRKNRGKQYTRVEARAAVALAEYYMLAGRTAFGRFVSLARLKNSNALFPASHRKPNGQPISETGQTFHDLVFDVGSKQANDYLQDLLGDGTAWFMHDATSKTPDHERPILVNIRPNQERNPGSSDLVVQVGPLFRVMDWNRSKKMRRQFIIDVLSSMLDETGADSKLVYWRMRAGIRVVRAYLDLQDEIAIAFQAEAIMTSLRMGCVFGIREHILLTPMEPADDPSHELVPAVKVLRTALFSESALQQELRLARNSHGLSEEALLALDAMITIQEGE